MEFVNKNIGFRELNAAFCQATPCSHVIIDNFFKPEVADELASEFPSFEENVWHEYLNPLEVKRTCNNWNAFPPTTYAVFNYLTSLEFSRQLKLLVGSEVWGDPGLHGGGWHCHGAGGKLNTHLDYSIHPKLKTQRKLNLIVYMSPDWDPSWGGALGFWNHDEEKDDCGTLASTVDSVFNRALIFDTTQNSWHGLPREITAPGGRTRNSLAVYYLQEAEAGAPVRERASFVPSEGQENDPGIIALIKARGESTSAPQVWKKGLD